jgi:phosphotransferase system enzyme I (PtsI)
MPEQLRGKGVISGIAIGKIMLVGQNIDGYLADYKCEDVAVEVAKVENAINNVVEILQNSVKTLTEKNMPEQAAIMEAHRMMAQDAALHDAAVEKVNEGVGAPRAVLTASEDTAKIFEGMDDAYFRERAVDIRDVGKRIAKYILGVKEPEIGDEGVILCGYEIEPSVIANIPTEKIQGVILGQGSTTCHAVIIAKARAIATVVGLGEKADEIPDGAKALLDGESGEIVIEPDEKTLAAYEEKLKKQQELKEYYAKLAPLPAETKDGVKVTLMANISAHRDVESAVSYGAEGVGLFRTEFVFMGREDIPNEEEQFKSYKEAVEKCNGHLCVIRTMDIGGDKPLAYLEVPPEENPFLGWRAIRISLQREDLFMPQIKAILRAGVYGKVAMMLPMVINVEEVKQVKALIEKAKAELAHEGKAYSDSIQIGIMVETPAAAVMTPVLARHVDFFSIGTNDLVQYTLAVDRVNHNVSYLYNHFNPAVLRLIQLTIQSAKEAGKWSGMCGEMASDPYAAVLLMAMGIDELSMSAPSIPRVKEKIRSVTSEQAKGILAKVMELEDGNEIKDYLYSKLQ